MNYTQVMLSHMLDGTPEGIRWFGERAESHATDLIDLLRGLDGSGGKRVNLLLLQLQAGALLAKIAREWADENEPSEAEQERDRREADEARMPGAPITRGWK